MTHTPLRSFLRVLVAIVTIVGSSLTLLNMDGAQKSLLGNLSAQIDQPIYPDASLQAPNPRFIDAYEQANAAGQFVLGLLLIVLGFMLHALMVSTEDRTVPVHAAPPKKKRRSWFWMEMRV